MTLGVGGKSFHQIFQMPYNLNSINISRDADFIIDHADISTIFEWNEIFIMCARKNGLQCVDIFVVIRNIHYFLGVNMYHYNSLHRHTIVCMVSKRWYNQKSWHMSKKIKRPFAWLHLSLLWWDMPSIDIYQRSRFVWACKASWPCSFSVLSQANLY